ncbi:MAG: MFS transporter [Armatimonadetes bacterium]|nr:MFS transporter [Armatimonadota bacterium]
MFGLTQLPTPVRRAFKWDAISAAIGGVSAGAMLPFFGVILRRDLDASAFHIAMLAASWSIGNLFNPLMAHFIRDRVKLPYAVWPPIISRAFYLLMPLAVVAPTFVAIAMLAAAMGSLAAPAYAAVIRDAYPVERRGFLMGLVRVCWVAGSMSGALSGGFLLEHFSYRWLFPVLALLGIAGVGAFARIGVPAAPEPSDGPKPGVLDGFRVLLTDRLFRFYAASFFLWGLGNLILGPVFPVFQVDELDISNQWVGYLATAASGISIVGYIYWGRLLDRSGPFRLHLRVIGFAAIAPITYYFAHNVPVLLIAALAQGLAMAGGDLGYVNASMRFGRREAVTYYAGTFAFLQAVRGIPGPFIGAALSEWLGPRTVFLIPLGLWLFSATIAFYGWRLYREQEEAD